MNRFKTFALLLICFAFAAGIRLSAPVELDNRDQAKQGLYILDVFNGVSFFLPTCRIDEPATKPPLYNWVAAAISHAYGKVTDITITLPSVFCGFGLVLLTFLIAEMLFSSEVALFAGLIQIFNYHFTTLSGTARTDMMLSFFITLSLFFFLLAYRNPAKATGYNLLMFTCFGLATITKGPVGIAVPLLAIIAFLFFKKDLKRLRSMQFGWGMLIWLVITLGWFIPALIEGKSTFFNLVIRKEMVNRSLGLGHSGHKGIRPFYFLLPHFFGKFLPWSLFMPSALVYFWKSKDRDEKDKFLFPVVWFFTVLIFFSILLGKRYDYIMPLYPAASIIVAYFWFTAIKSVELNGWGKQIKGISLFYLSVYFLLTIALLMFLMQPALLQTPAHALMINPEEPYQLQQRISGHILLFLFITLPFAAASLAGIIVALKNNLRVLFGAVVIAAALSLPLYFHILSSQATQFSGEQKKAFCERVTRKIGSTANLQFCDAGNSVLFYMGKNVRLLTPDQVLEFFRSSDDPYVITTETCYKNLEPRAEFEFVVLDESEYLARDKKKYVLLGKKKSELELFREAGTTGD